MKHIAVLFFACFLFAHCQQAPPAAVEQAKSKTPDLPQVDTSLFETFLHQDGDTTYLMKKYYICFLKAGPNRSQDEAEAAEIQARHLAHISAMADAGKICMAGPFDDDSDIRGILVFSVSNMEEAQQLAAEDPAVQAGRLVMEFHPWWAAVGSELF